MLKDTERYPRIAGDSKPAPTSSRSCAGVETAQRLADATITKAAIQLCSRARTHKDIDDLHVFLQSLGIKIVRIPRVDNFVPGYYSMLFEDPDGIRLEINHVPRGGVLEDKAD